MSHKPLESTGDIISAIRAVDYKIMEAHRNIHMNHEKRNSIKLFHQLRKIISTLYSLRKEKQALEMMLIKQDFLSHQDTKKAAHNWAAFSML